MFALWICIHEAPGVDHGGSLFPDGAAAFDIATSGGSRGKGAIGVKGPGGRGVKLNQTCIYIYRKPRFIMMQ